MKYASPPRIHDSNSRNRVTLVQQLLPYIDAKGYPDTKKKKVHLFWWLGSTFQIIREDAI